MKFASLAGLAAAVAAMMTATPVPVALAVTASRAASSESGSPLPYSDPNQAGWLTLCGTNLKPVTQGSVTGKPFVWRVVSDVAAPRDYFVKGAKATMFAYQPRRGTPAGAWSGTVMAAASYYHNQTHPMAQFTPIDSPLTQMTAAFPPIWDHLIELRLYLSAPDRPTLTLHYAAADIQIVGSTWRLVAGGRSSCTAGNVVAEETSVGMPGARAKPTPSQSSPPTASPASSSARSSPRSPGSTPSAGPGSSGGTTPTGAAPRTTPTALSRSSFTGVLTGLALAAAVIAIAVVWRVRWRRQRRATG